MKGDFTRNTFDPTKHFARVLMQQGRVTLDADWNEQTSILLYYLRTLAADIFGAHAGPSGNLGFEIIGNVPVSQRPQLDAKLTAIVPDQARRAVVKSAIGNGDMLIGTGRYYVDGILVENDSAILYSEQPGYPFNDGTTLEALKTWNDGFLLYLDVWERHITYVQDDHIREAALGGPDTSSRAQVFWQLKVHRQPAGDALFDGSAVSALPQLGTGKLRVRARPDRPPTELFVIPTASGYRGAENQLYRVEVHEGGAATGDGNRATFKWSRENGSVVFPIRTLSGTTVKLGHLGHDRRSGLQPGDWVELTDDVICAGERPGFLAQIETINRDLLTVTLSVPHDVPPLPTYAETDINAKHPLLRRWDHRGDLKSFAGALQITEQDNTDQGLANGWIGLENGVQVWFAKGGAYRAGDYWLIPARTATGDVEWPDELDGTGKSKRDGDGNPRAAAVGPQGPRHYYAPILLSLPSTGAGRTNKDCRCRIERLPCAG
jgi:hypothetical protein